MNKFIIKILAFTLTLFSFLFVVGKYDNRIIPNDINVLKMKSIKQFDSLDYLFIGNSYTYSAIDISYFDSLNVKAFNLGISSAGVAFYDVILTDYLKINKKPKNLLILVSPMIFSSEADDWKLYPIHRYLNQPISNESVFLNYDQNVLNYMSLLKKSFQKGISNFKPNKVQEKKLKDKGFVKSDKVFDNEVYEKTKKYYTSLKNDYFSEYKLEKLIQLTEKYKKQGINVIFYEIPTFKLKMFLNKNYLNDYNLAKEKIKKHKIQIISNNLDLDSTCFRNIDHCNSKGAKIYTKDLIKKLNL